MATPTKKPAAKKQPAKAKLPPKKQAKPQPKKKAVRKPVAPETPKHPLMLNDQSWNRELVIDHLCDCLASSSNGIGYILRKGYEHEGTIYTLPVYSTIMKWLDDDEQLSERYARAKDAQADFLGDEFLHLHEKAWVPVMVNGQPLIIDDRPVMTVNKASAAAVRLESENKKWLMGKLKPKKYGDKVSVGGADDLPPVGVSLAVEFVNP